MQRDQQPDWSLLTSEQHDFFENNGYLHLCGVLAPDEIRLGLDIIKDASHMDRRTIKAHNSFTPRDHTTRIRDAISQDIRLAHFLEHPGILGALVSVLGINVQVLGTEIFVRSPSLSPLAYWHTDGGAALQRTLLAPGSLGLQLKVQFFLTDVMEANCGNFILLPGSHRKLPTETLATCTIEELNGPLDEDKLPPGAIMIKARPGDAIIFPYGLWHAVAPNRGSERKTFIFRYGQLWHRPHDYFQQPSAILEKLSPRMRRMFGDFGADPHPTDYYKPQDQAEVMTHGTSIQ